MGESYWDSTSREIQMKKISQMDQEYRYITDNYEALNTKLSDITVYQLLEILDNLKGAKERAKWSRM
jgi:hypothetical protein